MAIDVEAAAYHEAGHVVALLRCGQSVKSTSVNDDGSGDTKFDELPKSEEDIVLVVLAGMHAEPGTESPSINDHVDQFFNTAAGAASDMKLLFERFQEIWLARSPLWYQTQRNRVQKFVEENRGRITAIADALLAKAVFPKTLDQREIEIALASAGS